MCLALPYIIVSVKGKTAIAKCLDLDQKPIATQLVKNLKKGDYVLVQNNMAVKKIPQKEAKEVYKLLK
jgi:hydrogenase assembly chaperone HypC/HupF